MIDQSLVTSGFDAEVLLSKRYIEYSILAQIEAGLLELNLHIEQQANPPDTPAVDLDITVHPPEDYLRLYEPHPDAPDQPEANSLSFNSDILFDHPLGADIQLNLLLTITDNQSGISIQAPIELFIQFTLEFDDDRGFQRNHRLAVEVLDIGGAVVAIAESRNVPKQQLLSDIKAVIDGDIPFGVVNSRVQRVEFRKHKGDSQTRDCFGVYVNLILKTGPGDGSFLADRGDINDAQNFLNPGQDIAFATASELYSNLGPDAKFRMAKLKDDDSGEFHFPLRKDQDDPDSEFGRIKSIKIRPETIRDQNNQLILTGRLELNLHGEYTDLAGDPDFNFKLYLKPILKDGLLDWEVDTDIEFGLAVVLVSFVIGAIVGAISLNVIAGIGTFLGLMIANELVAEPIVGSILADDFEREADLSFLDVFPNRIAVAKRRWDPLYRTDHQVVAKLENTVAINFDGLAFEGTAILGKQPVPHTGAVIRDEEREDEIVTKLRYRVNDFARFESDFEAFAPGTDRRTFSRLDSINEPTLVSLSEDEITDRLTADDDGFTRLNAPIAYIPRRISVVDGQIDQILCISRLEHNEQRNTLIREFRERTEEQIITDQGDDITEQVTEELELELGRPPTAEEIEKAFDDAVKALVDEAQVEFEENELPTSLRDAITALLRFDLAPEEFAAFQQLGVLFIEDKVIIVREGRPYYRDQADDSTDDNLLALPRYQPPFTP